MVMAFFVHIVLGQENGTTVMATVKTAASRVVQTGCFIDDIFPHLNTDRNSFSGSACSSPSQAHKHPASSFPHWRM